MTSDEGVLWQKVQAFHDEHQVALGYADDDEDAAGDVEDVHCTDAAAAAVVGFPEAAAYEAGGDAGLAFVAGHGDCATARDEPGDEAVVDDADHDGVAGEDDGLVRVGDVLGNIAAVAAVVGDGVG